MKLSSAPLQKIFEVNFKKLLKYSCFAVINRVRSFPNSSCAVDIARKVSSFANKLESSLFQETEDVQKTDHCLFVMAVVTEKTRSSGSSTRFRHKSKGR